MIFLILMKKTLRCKMETRRSFWQEITSKIQTETLSNDQIYSLTLEQMISK